MNGYDGPGTEAPRIKIFDANYLDCSKSQYVSYLKRRGYAVEALYYNALEHSHNVYEQICLQDRTRWHYDENGFQTDDWPLIGVEKEDVYAGRFDDIVPCIRELLAQGKAVFISVDGFYLAARPNTYMKRHEPHSLMIVGWRGDRLAIYDEAFPFLVPGELDEESMRQAYEAGEGLRSITSFSPLHPPGFVDRDEVRARYRSWLDAYSDDFAFYDRVGELLAGYPDDTAARRHTFEQLSAAFTLLNGSRAKFAEFTVFMHFPPEIPSLLSECAAISDTVRHVLNKAILTGRRPAPDFIESQCGRLKIKEREAGVRLRKEALSE